MVYGDSESNRYRINDLERDLGELRGEFQTFQNNMKFEVSDLNSCLKREIAEMAKSLKAVRDIAMAEIIAIKREVHNEADKDSLWYRINEMENNLESLQRMFPMIQTTLENHQSIIAMIQTTLVELKEKLEPI